MHFLESVHCENYIYSVIKHEHRSSCDIDNIQLMYEFNYFDLLIERYINLDTVLDTSEVFYFSIFEISYKKKLTFSPYSNFLRCTCI